MRLVLVMVDIINTEQRRSRISNELVRTVNASSPELLIGTVATKAVRIDSKRLTEEFVGSSILDLDVEETARGLSKACITFYNRELQFTDLVDTVPIRS